MLTVSHIFILQQFSMVISHCSRGDCGLHVKGAKGLFTTILLWIRGLFFIVNTFIVRRRTSNPRTTHRTAKAEITVTFTRDSKWVSKDCESGLSVTSDVISEHLKIENIDQLMNMKILKVLKKLLRKLKENTKNI